MKYALFFLLSIQSLITDTSYADPVSRSEEVVVAAEAVAVQDPLPEDQADMLESETLTRGFTGAPAEE